MTKDKWPGITVERIQDMLDHPEKLDDQVGWEDFLECFYKYYDWYWESR